MAEFSNYLENAIINATLRATSYTSPSSVFVALFTSDPTDAGSGTELSGNAYTRKAVTFGAPSNGVTSNSADVNFDQATGNWGTVSHIGIYDASTGGNLLYHTPLTSSKTIETGDLFKIAASSLVVTLA
jgi:hypothetical protein